eukprot:1319288-Amorphochlora_amoeboformis.AAC.1
MDLKARRSAISVLITRMPLLKKPRQTTQSKSLSTTEEIVVGTLTGVASTAVAHPLDTAKTRLQLGIVGKGGLGKALTNIIKKEGVRGLYRGLAAPVASAGVSCGLTFFAKSLWVKTLRSRLGYTAGQQNNCTLLGAAGALTGTSIAPVVLPTDLVKIRLQAARCKASTSALEFARGLAKREGLRAFTAGGTAGILQLASIWGVLFGGYEFLTRKITAAAGVPTGQRPGVATTIIAGSTVGVVSWSVAMPWDIIKTRMQMDPRRNPSFFGMLRGIIKSEGVAGFYRGFSAVAVRGVVSNASFFLFYEGFRGVLEEAKA